MASSRIIADRFEIHELAGTGGVASVYRASDRRSGQTVALKLLRTTPDSEAMERFAREAELLAQLSHPGVVRYVTHGHAGEDLYLAMEWLEGETLSKRLQTRGLTVEQTVVVAHSVASALGAAHAKGMLHRDVKPTNILLVGGEPSQVKLLDFGVARLFSSHRALTETGLVVGTPSYMSPEQARGDRMLDPRCDVFALGSVLYRCLTGTKAFNGADVMATLAKVLLEQPRPVAALRPDVPAALADLVAQMLSKHRDDRPADGDAVASALASVGSLFEGEPVTQRVSAALTSDERRMMCIVLSRAPPAHGAATGDTLRAAVASQGGHLLVLADGSLLVTLDGVGTPVDHATRAARCALAIRALLPQLPMVLAAGEAEVKGPVAVGPVIDRGAELLATLQQRPVAHADGAPAEVWLDDVIAGILDKRFRVRRDAGALCLLGERDAPSLTRTFLGKPSTCLGRERQLAILTGIWRECVEDSVARIVLVTGAPGIGKSRVLEELVRRVRADDEGAQIWMGRGDPMSARSPFGMIAGPIRHAADIRSGDAGPERRRKLHARVGAALRSGDVERVTEFLAELIATPFVDRQSVALLAARQDPQLMGDQLRRAWEDWLDAEAAQRPVLLVLEDLHWGDLPSVRFVDAAVRHLAGRPLMVLALARPEVYEWFPNIWNQRNLTELRLTGLTQRASVRLVSEALDAEVGEEIIARIVDRGEGNPFYLQELVRAAVSGKGEELPTTVLAMVQARLARLSMDARRLLRAASIFGRLFRIDGVFALLGDDAETTARYEWLSELIAHDVLERPREARFQGQAAFHHALIHEAAYSTLTSADRALGHRLAAQWLAQRLERGGDAEPVVLAEHFQRGGELAHAKGWYWRAAAQALEGNDHAAAVGCVEKAIACGASGEEEGALRLIECEARRWSGDNELCKQAAVQAMQQLPRGGAGWCAASSELAAVCGSLGNVTDLVELAGELETVEPRASRSQLIDALAKVARPLFWAGWRELGSRMLERATELEQLDAASVQPTALASLYMARGVEARLSGDPSGCVRYNELAVAQSERAGDLRRRAAAAGNLGYAFLAIGAYSDAEGALGGALETALRLGLPRVVATAQQNLGLAIACRGAVDDGIALQRTSQQAFEAQGDTRRAGSSLLYQATIELADGRHADAERTVTRALDMLSHNLPLRCHALAVLADAALAVGDVVRAFASASKAHELLSELGNLDEGESRVRLVHARALHAVGDVEAARRALGKARALLLARADSIQDGGRRSDFLAIPDHAQTVELARAWAL